MSSIINTKMVSGFVASNIANGQIKKRNIWEENIAKEELRLLTNERARRRRLRNGKSVPKANPEIVELLQRPHTIPTCVDTFERVGKLALDNLLVLGEVTNLPYDNGGWFSYRTRVMLSSYRDSGQYLNPNRRREIMKCILDIRLRHGVWEFLIRLSRTNVTVSKSTIRSTNHLITRLFGETCEIGEGGLDVWTTFDKLSILDIDSLLIQSCISLEQLPDISQSLIYLHAIHYMHVTRQTGHRWAENTLHPSMRVKTPAEKRADDTNAKLALMRKYFK